MSGTLALLVATLRPVLDTQRAPGCDVGTRFRLVKPLGRGGMGVLWVADDLTLGAQVVVKFLSDELARQPASARRLAKEAAAAARVRSPHVVQILDYGVSDGTPFLAMELLHGSDLRAVLDRQGRVTPATTLAIVRQVGEALAKAHAAGIVHRDVKPSNIFLLDGERDLFVKLLDFGLALSAPSGESSTSGARSGAGTPTYMSPEQIVGAPLDARSDVWSLGAVAFECLTGERAFRGETFGAIALAVHTTGLPRPSARDPSLPGAVDRWFARACARSKEDRFATAAQASDALRAALGSPRHEDDVAEQDNGHDPTRSGDGWPPSTRPSRRLSAVARRSIVVGALGSTAVAALGWAAWSGNTATASPKRTAPAIISAIPRQDADVASQLPPPVPPLASVPLTLGASTDAAHADARSRRGATRPIAPLRAAPAGDLPDERN